MTTNTTPRLRGLLSLAATGALLAAGLTGCGSHATGSPQAGGDATATSGQGTGDRANGDGTHTGTHTGAEPRHDATPGGGSSPSPSADGTLPKGSYDDTSGTRAKAPKNQAAVLSALPGVAAGGCVKVGSRTDVRSGRTAMGNFALARQNFTRAKSAYTAEPSFFYVVPYSRATHSITVVATRLGGHARPVTVRSRQLEQAAQWNYFPIQIQIPASGTWRFQVTTGADHGCFEASFDT